MESSPQGLRKSVLSVLVQFLCIWICPLPCHERFLEKCSITTEGKEPFKWLCTVSTGKIQSIAQTPAWWNLHFPASYCALPDVLTSCYYSGRSVTMPSLNKFPSSFQKWQFIGGNVSHPGKFSSPQHTPSLSLYFVFKKWGTFCAPGTYWMGKVWIRKEELYKEVKDSAHLRACPTLNWFSEKQGQSLKKKYKLRQKECYKITFFFVHFQWNCEHVSALSDWLFGKEIHRFLGCDARCISKPTGIGRRWSTFLSRTHSVWTTNALPICVRLYWWFKGFIIYRHVLKWVSAGRRSSSEETLFTVKVQARSPYNGLIILQNLVTFISLWFIRLEVLNE